jgi:hypothetical protein
MEAWARVSKAAKGSGTPLDGTRTLAKAIPSNRANFKISQNYLKYIPLNCI